MLMSVWGKVLSVDFILCLIAHYGLFFIGLEFVVGGFVLLVTVAIGGLCITSLLKSIMGIHFWSAGLSVSSRRMDTAIKISSRVEQPEMLLRFSDWSFSVGRLICLCTWKLFKVVSAVLLLVLYSLCFNYVPSAQEEMGKKLSFISAFQNRLIATAKKSKG